MKIWKNTKTLDNYLEGLSFTGKKEEADIALVGSKKITLEGFDNLKGIFRVGIGRDNIPFEEAKAKGILIRFPSSETVEAIYEETANFTCYLIFRMLYSEVGTLDPWVKFDRKILNEKKLLVIGMGNIGKRVYNKMKNFMHVLSFDIKVDGMDTLNKFLREADCVTLHIPKTEDNINFFGKDRLRLMKDGSVLINTSRGQIVSEDDLYEEIKKGRIKAAFDVFWEEPYNGKLKEFYPDKFFMTPHVASTCTRFLECAARDFYNFIEEIKND